MRKREQQDEKLMYEIAQENKRMSEPLRKARQVRELQHYTIMDRMPHGSASWCVTKNICMLTRE